MRVGLGLGSLTARKIKNTKGGSSPGAGPFFFKWGGVVASRISNRIRELRKNKKLTQKELAEMINKSERALQKYESGEITPKYSAMEDIAKALNVTIGCLIADVQEENDHWKRLYLKERDRRMTLEVQLMQLCSGFEVNQDDPNDCS